MLAISATLSPKGELRKGLHWGEGCVPPSIRAGKAPALLSVSGLCRLLKFGSLRADDRWAPAAVDESRRLLASDAHRQDSRDCPSDVKPRRES